MNKLLALLFLVCLGLLLPLSSCDYLSQVGANSEEELIPIEDSDQAIPEMNIMSSMDAA